MQMQCTRGMMRVESCRVRAVAVAIRNALKDSWTARGDGLPLLAVEEGFLWFLGVGFAFWACCWGLVDWDLL
jgi:hypothetical protein